MANNALYPSYYSLRRFEICNIYGEEWTDITSLVPEFYIKESMDNDCIRGNATLIDKAGLLETLPIRGEERIFIEVQDADENIHRYDFFLYKVDNLEILGPNDGMMYQIHFCSFSRMVSSMTRICQSYDDHIHAIAKDIFDKYFDISANGFKERIPKYTKLSDPSLTDSTQHLIIPNMTPNQAMNMLARRAYSDLYSSSSFRFFENSRGYHFLNDEDLFQRAQTPYEFTFSDAVKQDGSQFFEQRRNIVDFENVKRINTFEDINSGGYRNDVIEIDLVKKQIQTKPFHYLRERFSLNPSDGFQKEDHHTFLFSEAHFNDDNAKRFMVVKTNTDDEPGALSPDNHLAEMISSKVSYRYHLDKSKTRATSNGFLDITCGDLIKINMVDATALRDNILKSEENLYIVRTVDKSFVRGKYMNHMILDKVIWEDKKSVIERLNPNLV